MQTFTSEKKKVKGERRNSTLANSHLLPLAKLRFLTHATCWLLCCDSQRLSRTPLTLLHLPSRQTPVRDTRAYTQAPSLK